MLTRRHIRVKVLQSIYAFNQSEHKDLEKQENFLLYNMEQMQDLYLLMLQMLVSLRDQAENFLVVSQKKHLATELEKNPSKTFIDNKVISLISSNEKFKDFINEAYKNGHYLGAHSNQHLLYNDWSENKTLLVSEEVFKKDKASGWITLSDTKWGIGVGIRNFFEEYPKEIAIQGDSNFLYTYIWSPSVTPMAFARATGMPDSEMLGNFAQGLAKTTEFVYDFYDAKTPHAEILKQLNC